MRRDHEYPEVVLHGPLSLMDGRGMQVGNRACSKMVQGRLEDLARPSVILRGTDPLI